MCFYLTNTKSITCLSFDWLQGNSELDLRPSPTKYIELCDIHFHAITSPLVPNDFFTLSLNLVFFYFLINFNLLY